MAASAAGVVGHDDRVRFTTRSVPENPSVKDRTGLPFGVLVRPHGRCSRDGTENAEESGSDATEPTSSSSHDRVPLADAVARCVECFGYVNGYCGFERDGWICSLCGTFSYWPGGGGMGDGGGRQRRYRVNAARKSLPEINSDDFEMEVATEFTKFDAGNLVGTSAVYLVMLDLTAPAPILELTCSSVLAAMEAVPDCASIGVVAFDKDVYVADVGGDASVIKKIQVAKSGSLCLPLGDVLSLENFLHPIQTHKDRIADALEALRELAKRGGRRDSNEEENHKTHDEASSSQFAETNEPPLLGTVGNRKLSFGASKTSRGGKTGGKNTEKGGSTVGFLKTLVSPALKSKNKKNRGGLLDDPVDAPNKSVVSKLIATFRGADVEDDDTGYYGVRNETSASDDSGDSGDDSQNKKTGSRAFGPALEAVLTWLGAEGVAGGGDADADANTDPNGAGSSKHLSCRVLCFLAGAPDLGVGSVSRERRYEANRLNNARGINELINRGKRTAAHDAYANAAAHADTQTEPEHQFYANAGDAAALAAVVVDVFCVAQLCGFDSKEKNRHTRSADLASVAPLAERSGGALFWYGTENSDTQELPPVPRDVCRLLKRQTGVTSATQPAGAAARNGNAACDATHCTLRVRTSSEFSATKWFGSGIFPDGTYEGLFHVPRCSENDVFGFDFAHHDAQGFGKKGDAPPTTQVAFEFTVTEVVYGGGELFDGDGHLIDDDDNFRTAVGITRRRVRRVMTRQARVGSSPNAVFGSMDTDVVFGVLYRKILRAAVEDGIVEARELLVSWLCSLVAKRAHETSDTTRFGKSTYDHTDHHTLDGMLGSSQLPKLIHAALATSRALSVPGFAGESGVLKGVTPDHRVFSRITENKLGPEELRKKVYPEIIAWVCFGAVADAGAAGRAGAAARESEKTIPHQITRASRDALVTSNGCVFVADAHDSVVVFYGPSQPGHGGATAPFPPQRNSAVRHVVDRVSADRGARVRFLRGGVDDCKPFDAALVEELGVVLLVGSGTSHEATTAHVLGFHGFTRFVEEKARLVLAEGGK